MDAPTLTVARPAGRVLEVLEYLDNGLAWVLYVCPLGDVLTEVVSLDRLLVATPAAQVPLAA